MVSNVLVSHSAQTLILKVSWDVQPMGSMGIAPSRKPRFRAQSEVR